MKSRTRRQLHDFLRSAFTIDDLRTFLVYHTRAGDALASDVNWSGSLNEVVARVVAALGQHGALHDGFFDALVGERPSRHAELEALRACCLAPNEYAYTINDACLVDALRSWLEWVSMSMQAWGAPHSALSSVNIQVIQDGSTVALCAGSHAPTTIPQLLVDQDRRHWMLIGPPGSGKTTLLRDLALTWAQEGLQQLADGRLPSSVPIFVSLSPWGDNETSPLEQVTKQLHRTAGCPTNPLLPVLHTVLERGYGALLLDDFDCIDGDQRNELASAISFWSKKWPASIIFVAALPIGYQRPCVHFGEIEVLPLQADQWRHTIQQKLHPLTAQNLLAQIDARPKLQELASCPLILELMCNVARAGKATQFTRAEVLEQALQLGTQTRLQHPATARALLEELAYELMSLGGSSWPLRAVESILLHETRRQRLALFGGVSTFLQVINASTKIFFAPRHLATEYCFLHPSVHHFLTACFLLRNVPPKNVPVTLRWADVYSLLIELEPNPDARRVHLRRLKQADLATTLHVFASCKKLNDTDMMTVFEVGQLVPNWIGLEPGVRVAVEARQSFYGQLASINEPARAVAFIERILPRATVLELTWLWQTLEKLALAGFPAAQALLSPRFFELAGRPQRQLPIAWVEIPAGHFMMGCPPDEVGRFADDPLPIPVEIQCPFEMSAHLITNEMYRQFAPEHEPHIRNQANHPVTSISWYEAMIFAIWMNARLPTGVEWEYACRAGTTTATYAGDFDGVQREPVLEDIAWYADTAGGRTHPVGGKRPNQWGLYDMFGNADEWCMDAKEHSRGASLRSRMHRGGSWFLDANYCRAGFRCWLHPACRWPDKGIRLARTNAERSPPL